MSSPTPVLARRSPVRHRLVGVVAAAASIVAASCTTDETTDADPATTTAAAESAGAGPAPDPTCDATGVSTADLPAPSTAPAAPAPEPFTVDPALAGERITLYSGRDEELVQPLIDRFTESTGIDVDVRYGNSAEMGAQLLEEGDATTADVFYSQEVGAVGVLAKEGLLAELPAELVERVDERFRPGEDRNWVGVTGRSRVIVYHPDLVDEVPQCVDALTDPAYEGQVAIVPGNAGFQAFLTGYRVSEGDDAARAWLEAMIDNDVVTTFESNGDVLDAVNRGDIAVGLINHYYWARYEDRAGLRAQLLFPGGDDPGALVNATAAALTQRAQDDPAALAFVDFLLSEEGQTAFVRETWEYPVVDGIADPAGVPALGDLQGPPLDLTDLDSLAATQELMADVGLGVS